MQKLDINTVAQGINNDFRAEELILLTSLIDKPFKTWVSYLI